jgi:dipeptidase E
MKLYLSSYRVGNEPEKLTELVGSNMRTAVISNAVDSLEGTEREKRVEFEVNAMSHLGFEPEEIDLRDFFERPDKIETTLSKYGLLWIRDGNVFILRKAMALSGFDKVIQNILDQDIVYAGYSAGSCVVGPTLHGIELCDDVDLVPDRYPKETTWEGLGLVDYAIAPHYKSDHPESESIDKVIEYFSEQKIPYRALHDGEAIILNT